MIVDCHTQVWDAGGTFLRATAPYVSPTVHADASRHLEAVDPVDRAIVLAFKSRYLDAEIPNEFVAEYVQKYSAKLIGFAGIDPTERDALEELRIAQEDLRLKGVTISPPMQNFHPSDTQAMRVYEECQRRNMPILFAQNHWNPASKGEFGRPMLLDEIARELPELRVVIAHMGYPWIDETIVMLGKHRHVYADISGLLRQPWKAYNALLAAHEYGVIDKLLFGSDFPFRSPAACIEALYSINQVSAGTNLQTIPREHLRGIVERDALVLLGIESPTTASRKIRRGILDDDE